MALWPGVVCHAAGALDVSGQSGLAPGGRPTDAARTNGSLVVDISSLPASESLHNHAGSSVTSGLQQGFTRVPAGLHRRARLQNAKARRPYSPRAHGKDTTRSIGRHAKHPITYVARRWCTWASVAPCPHTVSSGKWRSSLRKLRCAPQVTVASGAPHTGRLSEARGAL